ncbi:uncharacterized protein LOC124453411 [Xenia sp. Carnegie-2017]|uniref:uncharacterized protein LOC124453411 n=1 Tax=Xenia sp. Carnegie-2017 TaxID=2897299 RepID=UPI001F046CE4|nr:uncharacterized protein LOC124453411 [Xenia sp. Carnegie-2017]
MAERIRNSDWENDEEMRYDLEKYVQRNFKRKEILDYMSADYPIYAWSIRTLSRRLQHFHIKYTYYDIALEDAKTAVKKELNGPGVLLGYRAMQQKVREVHGLNVSLDLVYAVMGEADTEGLQSRGGIGKQKRPRRTNAFGSNSTMSLDGHDKLCGYQKSLFSLCIYGGLDVYSGRVNFLKVWTTNSNPLVIGRFYFEYLFKGAKCVKSLRLCSLKHPPKKEL